MYIVCKIFNLRRNCIVFLVNLFIENVLYCCLFIVFKVLSWWDRDLVLVEGEVIFLFVIGLILSMVVEEFEVDILFVGDVVNVGVFCVWGFGDLVDDFEEVKMLLLVSGCDDGEIRGDIFSDEVVICIKLKLLISGFVIECK